LTPIPIILGSSLLFMCHGLPSSRCCRGLISLLPDAVKLKRAYCAAGSNTSSRTPPSRNIVLPRSSG